MINNFCFVISIVIFLPYGIIKNTFFKPNIFENTKPLLMDNR